VPFYDQSKAAGVEQPPSRDSMWFAIGAGVVFGLLTASFWFGKGGFLLAVVLIAIAAVIVMVFTPHDLDLGVARLISLVATAVIILLLLLSGLPLVVAEVLSPIAQSLQGSGNIGVSAELLWLIVVAILVIGAIAWWVVSFFFTADPRKVIVAGLILGLASFPVVGMLAQGAMRNPGGF